MAEVTRRHAVTTPDVDAQTRATCRKVMANHVARMILRHPQLRPGLEPVFLAHTPREMATVYGLPVLETLDEAGIETWADLAQPVIDRLADIVAGQVRCYAPLEVRAPHRPAAEGVMVPFDAYEAVERLWSDRQGIAVTLTILKDDTDAAIWVGYV